MAPDGVPIPSDITEQTNGHLSKPTNLSDGASAEPAHTFPGPIANGKQTSVHLLDRTQLIASGLLPQLTTLINVSFNSQHTKAENGILTNHDRLTRDDQLLEEFGHAPGTFVYIITTANGAELVGTAYASLYVGVEQWPEGPGERVWERLGLVEEGWEAWELHMMAVHPGYQRQGLADYLMRLVDAEVVKRHEERKRLVLYISTIKETNESFYLRKGFKEKYAVHWPAGTFGSAVGFTVVHMDREIRVAEESGK